MQGRVNLHGIIVGNRDDFEAMNECITQHKIQPAVSSIFPFEETDAAFRMFAQGKHFGKVVIEVSPDIQERTLAPTSRL